MSKKIIKSLVFLFSILTLLASCQKNLPSSEASSLPESSLEISSSKNPSSNSSSSESDDELLEPNAEDPISKDDFYKKVVLNFGAFVEKAEVEYNPFKEDVLREEVLSFYYLDDFDSPTKIDPVYFYSWYVQYMLLEDLTYEERVEKYSFPGQEEGTGWFFPEDIYLENIKKYFDVTDDFLKNTEIYNKELKGFQINSGGGIGERHYIFIESIEENADDTTTLHLMLQLVYSLSADESNYKVYKDLTIKEFDDGTFNYLSYRTIEK